MMKRGSYLALASAALLLSGCQFVVPTQWVGSGNVVSETREVTAFTGISLSGVGELILVQGDQESLRIEAEDNLMRYITSTVKQGVLELSLDDRSEHLSLQPTKPIIYYVTIVRLDRLSCSGATKLTGSGLNLEALSIDVSGAAAIDLANLRAESLRLQISGTGMVQIVGQVEEQEVDISGLANYDAGQLQSLHAEVAVSGSGTATVWSTETLGVDISGLAQVKYHGSPRITLHEISGGGKLVGLDTE
jgi:hypothetical protein